MKIDFKYGDKEFNGAKIEYLDDRVVVSPLKSGAHLQCYDGYDLFRALADVVELRRHKGELALMNSMGWILPERYENLSDLIYAGELLRACQFPHEMGRFKAIKVKTELPTIEF